MVPKRSNAPRTAKSSIASIDFLSRRSSYRKGGKAVRAMADSRGPLFHRPWMPCKRDQSGRVPAALRRKVPAALGRHPSGALDPYRPLRCADSSWGVRQRLCASRSSFCSLSIVSACLFPVDCEAEVGSVNLTFMNITSQTTRHRTSHCNEVISQRVGRLSSMRCGHNIG
jgi:hypothetical protein